MKILSPILAAAGGHSTLTGLDWLMILLYFGILFCVAWWVIKKGKDETADYFLAGRNLSWWIIGASIFASNIGSEHIVGLAGSGAKDGVALAHYEFHAWCLLVLAWIFVPFYGRFRCAFGGRKAVGHGLLGVHDEDLGPCHPATCEKPEDGRGCSHGLVPRWEHAGDQPPGPRG